MMTIKSNNVFYFRHINKVGGIETFYYYLAKHYKNYDITFVYNTGDSAQIRRLRKYVRVVQYQPGMQIRCKKAFFNYNIDIIESVEADEYYQIAHGDYKAMQIVPPTHKKLGKWIGVSKQVVKSFEEVTGHEAELCYNPVYMEVGKRPLRLISATRLTPDKGRDRMEILAKALDKADIPYLWLVFTDSEDTFNNPNIIRMEPRLDITDFVATSDYLVQLSDAEAYCYSVVESLCVGTPVIVTDLPVYKELGLTRKNSFKLPLDMSQIPVKKIQEGLEPFEYKPKKDRWNQILVKGKGTYQDEIKKTVTLEVTAAYYDLELDRLLSTGEEVPMNILRARYIEENDKGVIIDDN